MQGITPPSTTQLLAAGQVPLLKFEIYVGEDWVNLCTLDTKNYVESVGISLGGAGMTPNPIGGTWNATLSNENSIFHPQHPSSTYKGYNVTGRKARISIGATYGGSDYYWPRLIGFMEEPKFEVPGYKVSISGADYMKLLQDTEFKELDDSGEPDNYWGTKQTFSSVSSTGLVGDELYVEEDAMDINLEDPNVANWTSPNCDFASYADGGGSTYVGRVTNIVGVGNVENTNIANAGVTEGKEYRFKFKYRMAGGTGAVGVRIDIKQSGDIVGRVEFFPDDNWIEGSLYFIAAESGAVQVGFYFDTSISNLWLDQFSLFEFMPYQERFFQLPGASKGPHYVTYNPTTGAEPVWEGEKDEGWLHEEATRRVAFDINKTVINGTNNVVIYYYTVTAPEDVVARILFKAGLYASEAAAKAAMEYTATGITIDKVWFEAGSSLLSAIRLLCERCDYRFYFKHDGTPVFKPKSIPGETSFAFTDPKHIASASTYQDRGEIKNRIVIKGLKRAEPTSREETMPSELRGEVHDDPSIDEFGERTLTINNHLFQDQDSISHAETGMCAILLAEYKEPKWYTDLQVPFNPVPLELGDKISWKERLSPVLEDITQTGIIRDIKLDGFNATYRCELV